MARKANSLFNQENTLDFLLFVACFPYLFADVANKIDGSFDQALYDEFKDAIIAGNKVLPGAGNKFDAPPMEPAKIKHEIIKSKRTDFYATLFQQYGDSAQVKTATEIKQDFRTGIEAVLQMQAEAMDEYENSALFLIEQAEMPTQKAAWGGSRVARPNSFTQIDVEDRLEKLVKRHTATNMIPVDADTLLEIVVESLTSGGIDVDDKREAAIRVVIEQQLAAEAQAVAAAASFWIDRLINASPRRRL